MKNRKSNSTPYSYSLKRKAPVSLAVLACLLMLTACGGIGGGGGGSGITNYQVNGQLDIQNVDCELAIPGQVKVHAELFKGGESVSRSGDFGSNGPFNLTIPWPNSKGQPEGWRITAVTRQDGTEICTPENTCGEGRQCLDMATKERSVPLNNPIDWRVRCRCMGR